MKRLTALLLALADLIEKEQQPEAQATADALRTAKNHAFPPCAASMLDAKIRALAQSEDAHPSARVIGKAQARLPWRASPAAAAQPAYLAAGKAVATLLDPEGPIYSGSYRFGLYYQAPEVYYPLHAHEAAETYVILAGTALWRAGDTRHILGPGDAIHHRPQTPHAMRAGPSGFLAIWRWSGEIGFDSYHMLPDPEEVKG